MLVSGLFKNRGRFQTQKNYILTFVGVGGIMIKQMDPRPEGIKINLCSTHISMKFFLFINI